MLYIVCYSGGHSSALAAIETVRRYGKENVILLNHDICEKAEHADIKRFKQEVANYLGVQITYANMPGYESKDQFDCMVAGGGNSFGLIHCTRMLKTEPFNAWLNQHYPATKGAVRDDITVVYGFDPGENTRIDRRIEVMNAMGYRTEYPLCNDKRSIYSTEEIGIKRPVSYEIFNHANCIGCLKAGKQHWYVVYCLYPDVFSRAKQAEAKTGFSILKTHFLKDIEAEFAELKAKGLPATEKIKPQIFWAMARKMRSSGDGSGYGSGESN